MLTKYFENVLQYCYHNSILYDGQFRFTNSPILVVCILDEYKKHKELIFMKYKRYYFDSIKSKYLSII